jgi:DNA topoisomerase-2
MAALADTYRKKSHEDHVLTRPDSYVGSTKPQDAAMWVVAAVEPPGPGPTAAPHFVYRADILYNPGLDKIFDEIVVNAFDHAIRQRGKGVGNVVTSIRVTLDTRTYTISVCNDGPAIPVAEHPEYKIYIPELIFGHLLTGSNYDDTQERLVSGRNGYGAKLTNIFSERFQVEIVDAERSLKYVQTWENNMKTKHKAVVTASKGKNYVKITWAPDLVRFGYPAGVFPADMALVYQRRVWDIAAALGKDVKVYWNDDLVKITSFANYAKLYMAPEAALIHEVVNDRWEVAVMDNPLPKFMQVSFVNGTWTSKGGTHVTAVKSQIINYISEYISKKKKGGKVSANIENELALFVRCEIVNPEFAGQMKETLTTRPKDFGSECTLSEGFLKKVISKLGVVARLLEEISSKEEKEAKKSDGRKTTHLHGIPKLEDAELAGTAQSEKCTLILTEGDSAKALVTAGLSDAQRKVFGVFPLKGKILNVRDAGVVRIHENAEIANLKKILGLQTGKTYTDTRSLRYGRVMFMTDQDLDGSHIKGLGINLFHTLWRELSLIPGFLAYMATPIVKATPPSGVAGGPKAFLTLQEFEAWKEATPNAARWSTKYYKGLGTSNSKESKEYFASMNIVKFVWTEASDEALDLAFSKTRADDRKQWLLKYDPEVHVDHHAGTLPYDEFIHKDMIGFSWHHVLRSTPNVMDGLKVSQRKILYAAFKRNLTSEIKVAQFAGYISEHTAYHHGEDSLSAAIVGMAQDFMGSNNINLFSPNGQFGTRNMGGEDSASPRYICTCLTPITFALFPKAQLPVLKYEEDDGEKIEPKWFAPVLPLLLVNGCEGIGTGFSTSIPSFNPCEIADYLLARLEDDTKDVPWSPTPWYDGFKGSTTLDSPGTWTLRGCYTLEEGKLTITELPPGVRTDKVKEICVAQMEAGVVSDYICTIAEHKVFFEVLLAKALTVAEVETMFHLAVKLRCSNMHVFDATGHIQKCDTPKSILDMYMPNRLQLYAQQRQHRLDELEALIPRHENTARFLKMQVDGTIDLRGKPRAAVREQLEGLGLGVKAPDGDSVDVDYLLRMPFSSITNEEIEKHVGALHTLKDEHAVLLTKTPRDLWTTDIHSFKAAYADFVTAKAEAHSAEVVPASGGAGGAPAKKAPKKAKATK